MSAELLTSLARIVGDKNVLTGDAAAPHYIDWRGRYQGTALAVVLPADTHEVAEVVKLCAANNVAIVPQGGNTSHCGASVPLPAGDQVVVNLTRMNRIRAVDAVNYSMTVEAGCTLESVKLAAEAANRMFPLGLTAIAHQCEIGGNLATNAGGLSVLRYGNVRDMVLGVEAVLPDGRIWDGLRGLRKDNTGYDLKQLFIGAEGTLGIVTAAVLKLFPRPQAIATACIAVRDPAAAVALLAHLRASCGDKISAFEIVSRSVQVMALKNIPGVEEPLPGAHKWIVLAELSDALPTPLEGALKDALGAFGDGIVEFLTTSDKARAEKWWKLRKGLSEAQKIEGISIKHDVSVPVAKVAEFIARADAALGAAFAGVRIVAFGHLGDGNIHYNASMADSEQNKWFIGETEAVNRIVYDIVHEFGGSISAEHGLGQLKRETIKHYRSALELELMKRIKDALDPKGLMNPGKVI